MTDWIDLNEMKPPNGELVLACDMADECLSTSFRVVWMVGDKWYSGYCRGDIEPPTHWMPLPDAPDTEGQDAAATRQVQDG